MDDWRLATNGLGSWAGVRRQNRQDLVFEVYKGISSATFTAEDSKVDVDG